MALESEILKSGRGRLQQIFRYLEALNQIRNPVKRLVREQPWVLRLRDLPDHPAVRKGIFGAVPMNAPEFESSIDRQELSGGEDFILKVRRPNITAAPPPPSAIAEWLHAGWNDVDGQAMVHSSRNTAGPESGTLIERFDDDPERARVLQEWKERRDEWVRNEKPARATLKIFERLYELYGQIEREAERVELVLGDGILNWRRPEGGVHHPIVLQRLQLEFDAQAPEFTLRETEHPVELYSALFRSMPDVDGRAIAKCRQELEKGGYHPLDGDATSGFFRRLIVQLSAKGEFTGDGELYGEADHPRIGRDAVVFMRTRTLGFATGLEALLEDLQNREDLPSSLLNVVGVEPLTFDQNITSDTGVSSLGNEDDEILLSKPANREQLQIARRLDRYGCVLVQGPPGTGKTHTIGNLIGHLLAQGKRVLVTSHTTKALRVLRHQVVEQLRPLCISVLESDTDSQGQLENSIESIVERLSSSDGDQLESEAATFYRRRRMILERLRNVRQQLIAARANEYRDIVIDGQAYPPSEAARKVNQRKGQDDWLPSPITLGAPLPLPPGEIINLYRTNGTVTAEDERELTMALPKPADLPSPAAFERLIEVRSQLTNQDRTWREDLWENTPQDQEPEALEELRERSTRAAAPLCNSSGWQQAAITASWMGGAHHEPWDDLLVLIGNVYEESARAEKEILRYGPSLADDEPLETQAQLLGEIVAHLEGGGKLSRLTRLTHPSWKRLLTKVRVSGDEPNSVEQFRSLQILAKLQVARRTLIARWERQIVPLGGPSASEFGERPEWACAQYTEPIKTALAWYGEVWRPLEETFKREGFHWNRLLTEMPRNLAPHGELLRLRDAVLDHLPSILAARATRLRWERVEREFAELANHLAGVDRDDSSARVVRRLREAVARHDATAYREAFERLTELYTRQADRALRRELLRRLEASAPAWAAALRDRQAPHDSQTPPGDIAAAWLWRQLHDELEVRSTTSLEVLLQEIARLNTDLQRTTAELVDRRAWAAQVRRTNLQQRKALVGWLQTVRKIGKGTGKRVPQLRATARALMNECRTAVPVWIMPLARVVESFDLRTTRFDVVIIDEASQSDAMALIALYMGHQVVVVGDHEQVSPDAVGQRIDEVQHLIGEHLQGIPNATLYDGQLSVYDLAMQSFGGTICLREHFRCVPEIIEFSNHLSYDGQIKPLRDVSHVNLKPRVLAYRVGEATSENKVNRQEAYAVASLLAATVEQPEYDGKTFGVVSLVGDEQAREIETLLRQHLPPVEYERRKIVCGNAAQFQGDERDVMFLSVVDGPQGGPLRLRDAPMYKKRFNVAASRARDQMWVVHSLSPEIDLKAGDLRRRLIQHAEDPAALMRSLERVERQTESEFERLVLRRLVAAGYRVIPQWKVGYYRIDMVVEGGGKRLAIECDGDRYHPLDTLQDDLERQAILERLGWTFTRIRGSEFFRDPDRAMAPVFARLSELEISPEGSNAEERQEMEDGAELRERVTRRAQELLQEWDNPSFVEATSTTSATLVNPDPQHGKFDTTLRPQRSTIAATQRTLFEPPHLQDSASFSLQAPLGAAARAEGSLLPDNTGQRDSQQANGRNGEEPTSQALRSTQQIRRREGQRVIAAPSPAQVEGAREGATGDPLFDAVTRRLPHASWTCTDCGGHTRLWIGRKGPFLKCDAMTCGKTSSVAANIIAACLRELDVRCGTCTAPVAPAHGKQGAFVGCSRYPACSEAIPWKDLRSKLRKAMP